MSIRTFALIFGAAFLLIGIGGFMIAPAAPGPEPDLKMTHGFGHALGLFPVNTLHNIVHIAFGLWGLAASRGARGALLYARSVAILYTMLTALGLIEATDTAFGFVPLYGNDVWLHALLALVATYFGWMHDDRAASIASEPGRNGR